MLLNRVGQEQFKVSETRASCKMILNCTRVLGLCFSEVNPSVSVYTVVHGTSRKLICVFHINPGKA